MGRFFVFLACVVILFYAVYHWRRYKRQRAAHAMKKRHGHRGRMKSKGKLVQDPKTGEYHVESDDNP